ncbi:MAG: hypothetical protein IH948_07685 [Bacteroidetes bacterium]|nr:hypothetical protein [Bacteroidota bacterium]
MTMKEAIHTKLHARVKITPEHFRGRRGYILRVFPEMNTCGIILDDGPGESVWINIHVSDIELEKD